jgi:DNA-binding phage protein
MPRTKSDPDTLRVAPIVRNFFEIVHASDRSYQVIADDAGVSRETIVRWQSSASPSLTTFIAAVNAMGYDVFLQPVTQADSGANNIGS